MRGKALQARRQKNRELAIRDMANRCASCKRSFSESKQIVESFLVDAKFCSDACLDDYTQAGKTPKPLQRFGR